MLELDDGDGFPVASEVITVEDLEIVDDNCRVEEFNLPGLLLTTAKGEGDGEMDAIFGTFEGKLNLTFVSKPLFLGSRVLNCVSTVEEVGCRVELVRLSLVVGLSEARGVSAGIEG